jgi:hypothetical protein
MRKRVVFVPVAIVGVLWLLCPGESWANLKRPVDFRADYPKVASKVAEAFQEIGAADLARDYQILRAGYLDRYPNPILFTPRSFDRTALGEPEILGRIVPLLNELDRGIRSNDLSNALKLLRAEESRPSAQRLPFLLSHNTNFSTLVHVAAMNRLERFFAPPCTGFSGGVLGVSAPALESPGMTTGWGALLICAAALCYTIEQYVSEHPISIGGGVTLEHPVTPLLSASEAYQDALEILPPLEGYLEGDLLPTTEIQEAVDALSIGLIPVFNSERTWIGSILSAITAAFAPKSTTDDRRSNVVPAFGNTSGDPAGYTKIDGLDVKLEPHFDLVNTGHALCQDAARDATSVGQRLFPTLVGAHF